MQPDRKQLPAFLAVFGAALIGCIALGDAVASRPPGAFDLAARALADRSDLLAWLLTEALFFSVLAPLFAVLLAVAWRKPDWRARIFVSLGLVLVLWAASDQLQHLFMRPRRLDWFVKHETAFSYPSTHAALATALYGYWAYAFARSELARRTRFVLAGACAALLAATLWARLALGAHYPSDLLGGVLLGTAGIALALTLCTLLRVRLQPPVLRD